MSTDDAKPFSLIRAVVIQVSCLLHGKQSITGKADVSPLGYGRSYIDQHGATCTACKTDDWLQLIVEIDDDATLEVTASDFSEAMMEALAAEMGAPEAESDDSPAEPSDSEGGELNDEDHGAVPKAQPVPPTQGLPVFQRRPLGG